MATTALVSKGSSEVFTPFYQSDVEENLDICRLKSGHVFAIVKKAASDLETIHFPKMRLGEIPMHYIFLAPLQAKGDILVEGGSALFLDRITTGGNITVNAENAVLVIAPVKGNKMKIDCKTLIFEAPPLAIDLLLKIQNAFLEAVSSRNLEKIEQALLLTFASVSSKKEESLQLSSTLLSRHAVAAPAAAESKGDSKTEEKKDESPKKA
ncbi:MAG: hypothetical protein HYX48_02235 [Chlamydiales bacterium]|nr:hypothetical protein [Chlamydiales bacterium]